MAGAGHQWSPRKRQERGVLGSCKTKDSKHTTTTMINYSIVMRSVNANLLEINQARVLAPSPAYPPTKNSTFNTQHSTFKKNESEHLENNSSDSHQHTDRYRYYARSNELHGIKTKRPLTSIRGERSFCFYLKSGHEGSKSLRVIIIFNPFKSGY